MSEHTNRPWESFRDRLAARIAGRVYSMIATPAARRRLILALRAGAEHNEERAPLSDFPGLGYHHDH